jgi:hypothetical protein
LLRRKRYRKFVNKPSPALGWSNPERLGAFPWNRVLLAAEKAVPRRRKPASRPSGNARRREVSKSK